MKTLNRTYWAHYDERTGRHHPLEEHLREVGKLAARFADVFGSAEWGRVAGIAHDLGKASEPFQRRLTGGPPVDHATAGAQWLAGSFGGAGRLLAYGVAGHHGGMPDGLDETGASLTARLSKSIPEWDRRILQAVEPSTRLGPLPLRVKDGKRLKFQAGFFVRMLFSCLVDADFLDTERFFASGKAQARGGYPPLADLLPRLDAYLRRFTTKSNPAPIDHIRAEILDACRAGACLKPGFFSLTVPTGGGKTLASLAFAMEHARVHTPTPGFRRVIYAIPYTSIIEQTAGIFREALGDEAVLEHHSNYDPLAGGQDEGAMDPSDDSTRPGARWARLATENWDAPVVVTTNVQFFESLFHNRPSRCRRLHNIARSIVILDEAQMLPVDYLLPCLEALRELVLNYGVSVVLCTATQPALKQREDFPAGLEDVRELMPDPDGLAQRLKRVTVAAEGPLDDDTLAGRIASQAQVLCIVNTRGHAARLFAKIHDVEGAFHLSANMCPAHRSSKLGEIKERLKAGLPCRVVSTQLVEAGVDVDFPAVYRAAAGTDSIAQAAGRCNREGRMPTGHVHVFDVEARDLPPGLLRHAAEEGQDILRRYAADPLSLAAMNAYFEALYWRRGDNLDKRGILQMFTEGAREGNFAFRSVAEKFRLIEDAGATVIVPWDDESRRLIEKLDREEAPYWLLRKLQRYSITVRKPVLDALEAQSALRTYHERYRVLVASDLYREDTGLDVQSPSDPALLVI